MTTIYAAAAARRVKSIAIASTVLCLGFALAGCETSNNLLGSSNILSPATEVASPAPTQNSSSARLAVAPVIGAPDAVAKQMQASLSSALIKQNISVAQNATDKSDYTLRGYVVSAREKAGVKVSYIWDVTDPTGQRVNRITGEEVVNGGSSRDPWSSVSAQVIDTISTKTASQVATWMPKGSPVAAPPSSVPVAAAPAATSATRTAAVAPVAAGPTTGSIERGGPSTAFVPNVTGAPGDGRISLTSALQRELSRNGVALATTAANTYRVEGVVDVGQSKDGKQPIKIDWHVKDPTGKSLGTVSQKNEIAAGALDGAWGATADAAAAAAAQGILKLIPKATN